MLSVLDTFSGIGGFSYGLEMLCGGYKTVAFCEVDEYCRKVLAKHWPDVPCYGDIKEVTVERLREDGLMPIDLVCGGFPCQDISVAGKGAGIQGARSGLWAELCRLIGEIRPRWAVMENVSALLGRGLGTVLGDLAAIGYDAEWHCIPASCVGAPHHRDRIWIVADSQSCDAGQSQVGNTKRAGAICAGNGVGLRAESGRLSSDFPDAGGLRCDAGRPRESLQGIGLDGDSSVADADGIDCRSSLNRGSDADAGQSAGGGNQPRRSGGNDRRQFRTSTDEKDVANAESVRGSGAVGQQEPQTPSCSEILRRYCAGIRTDQRETGSDVGGSPYGISAWLDGTWEDGIPRVSSGGENRPARIKCLGNGVVPQVVAVIGKAILESEVSS